jgi:YkoY family integral membrane protein
LALDPFLHDLGIVLTLLVLEAVLSFDNAAVLAAIVRKLPLGDRRKALLYGLVGAYALRITAILLASFLIRTPALKVVGGLYLLFLGVRHFYQLARHRAAGHKEHKVSPGWLVRLGVPALVAVIIQIEVIDLAFAVDQVVVAVAFTDEILLIVIASMLGILFLRLAAAVVARVMDWLPLLEHMAYVAVTYVGVKLILLHPWFVTNAQVVGRDVVGGACRVPFIPVQHQVAPGGLPGCEIPTPLSVTVTLALFGVPILLKLLFGIPRSTQTPPPEMVPPPPRQP